MKKIETKNLPPKFIQNILGLYGAKGERWLEDLPGAIAVIADKWSLEIDEPFPNLSFNFVAPCSVPGGGKYVLKVGVPEEESPILFERKALEAFAGEGAVKLIKYDESLCAMLIERAVEGKTLSDVCGADYEKAVKIAVAVMKRLPRNPPDKTIFINLEKWTSGLNKAVKMGFEPDKVAEAQKYFTELAEPFEKKILLHGDVHFDNILSARRESFLLIDPKGAVGEIGYEIAVFLNDLAGWTKHLANQKQILSAAVENFSQSFAVSSENLRKWAFAFAVLSGWWMLEDFGKDWENSLACAKMWKEI